MTKHTYPKTYLRKACYRVITDFTKLGHCFLVRFSDVTRPYTTIEEFKEKLNYHFGTSQILTGISTILLCRLKKRHLWHQIIKPRRNSIEPIDVRRGKYFEDCNDISLCPIHEDLYYDCNVQYFGVRIKDVVKNTVDLEIKVRDKHGNSVTVQTDVLKFGVVHTPKRSDFWHCDIVLTGIDGNTGGQFVVNELNRPELDSKGKVSKKTAALIALLEDSICLRDGIKTKQMDWSAFSTIPIGRKAKKEFRLNKRYSEGRC